MSLISQNIVHTHTHSYFWKSVLFLVIASFAATYRRQFSSDASFYRHFKKNILIRDSVVGSGRYTSSAGSFIILQSINLVSVRVEGERVYVGSRVYRFQWQVKYRRIGETISGEKEWLSKEGSFFEKKNGTFLFIAIYRGREVPPAFTIEQHVQARDTEYQNGFLLLIIGSILAGLN